MNETTVNQHPAHAAEIDNLFNRMKKEMSLYEHSIDGLKDVRLQSSLNVMIDTFIKLPLTPADKTYAGHKHVESMENANELQGRVSQLENIVNGIGIDDPLQTDEYEQALLDGDNKKAAKLEAAARQLRMDRHTATQQINTLMPAMAEAKQTASIWGRIADTLHKSILMQELHANKAIFGELLERILPVWAEMNRLCVDGKLKAEHLEQLEQAFNRPEHRLQVLPFVEQVMRFDLQRRPYF